jgi:hypothetical protein
MSHLIQLHAAASGSEKICGGNKLTRRNDPVVWCAAAQRIVLASVRPRAMFNNTE